MAINGRNGNGDRRWKQQKEKILFFGGLLIILVELINAELLGGTFHPEFLIAGAALCGISITTWGDKKH